MRLTRTLLGYLNRVFDKNPRPFNAFTITSNVAIAWEIADQVLTITFPGSPAATITVDLTQYTLGALADYLAGVQEFGAISVTSGSGNGFFGGLGIPQVTFGSINLTVSGLNRPVYGNFGAVVLLDGSGSNGTPLQGYTSLLYVIMDAIASEVQAVANQIANAPNEMATTTADGEWLDFLGSFYDVPRQAGEADSLYGPRIISTVIRPLNNNGAIENALLAQTGQAVSVVSVVTYGPAQPEFGGLYTFDGAVDYNPVVQPLYNLFDITIGYDLLGGTDPSTFATDIAAQVELLRAAGTHLRALALQTSAVSDTYPSASSPVDAGLSGLTVMPALTDAATPPTDSMSEMSMVQETYSDAFTAATDSSTLNQNYTTVLNGGRNLDGSWPLASGTTLTGSISGPP